MAASSVSRPEHVTSADKFYDETESRKYTGNSRVTLIQTSMAHRCLELLALPEKQPAFLLDIGCGSGLSGDVLTEAGHVWTGVDLSKDMLQVGLERGVAGDTMVSDIGQGFGFRPGAFDGAISVSAIQWLCYSMKKEHVAVRRLFAFFTSLYRALKRGARAALQLYPETPEQLELITSTALRCGFGGGLVVDFPNSTKAKKYFLCLFAGVDPAAVAVPKGLGAASTAMAADGSVHVVQRKRGGKAKDRTEGVKSKAWIKAKKERQRRQGKDVRKDSKYTGRKRKDRF